MIRAIRRVFSGLVVACLSSIIHHLPTRLWLRIKAKTQVVKPMDYSKPVYLHVDSWIENEVRLKETQKEPGTVDWIESWFKKGDVFYDIGANVGSYSLIAHRFLDGQMQGYAFEPGFLTFPQLCRNLSVNSVNGCISPLQVALSDRTDLIPFHYHNMETGGALHALGDAVDQFGKPFKPAFKLPTLSFRLDDLVSQFHLALPHHIKIDVDGVEYQILQGAQSVLNSQELRSIVLELDNESDVGEAMSKLLIQCGFTLRSQFDGNCLYAKA